MISSLTSIAMGILHNLIYRLRPVALILFVSVCVSAAQDGTNDSVRTITERLHADVRDSLKRGINPSRIADSLKRFKANGSFSDVDYKNKARSNWPPLVHLNRLLDYSVAYTTRGNSYYHQADLGKKIIAGLEFWHQENPRSSNWWFNEIAAPHSLGKMMLLLKVDNPNFLPKELQGKLAERMSKSGNPRAQAGANKTDVAMHYLYRACVTEDAGLMKYAFEQIFYPLRYTSAEGIQNDLSYHQHGPQLYIGGYGSVIVFSLTHMGIIAKDTEFGLQGEQLDIFSRFVRETYLRVIRGSNFSYNVLGRGVTREGSTSQRGLTSALASMSILDPANVKEYKDAALRLNGSKPPSYAIGATNTSFYRSDYMVHQRPGFTFDVRTVSRRTARNEQGVGNGEGYKQYFLSDGAMALQATGNEYYDIYPVWDWAKIPGVTCPHMNKIPLAPSYITKGASGFTGGVSDGIYGAYAYDYTDNYQGINSSGKKAWFFFDEEVVCLGCDIQSSSSHVLGTTVNQCHLTGPVIVSSRGRETKPGPGTYKYSNNLTWVMHGGMVYYFPQGNKFGKFELKIGPQQGAWHDINTNHSKTVLTKDVFNLWIDHGKSPKDAAYQYVILPNKHSLSDLRKHRIKDLHIISNESPVQAVYQSDLDILQIVFWDKADFTHQGIAISVDKPCIMMVRNIRKPQQTWIHVADPSHSHDKVSVKIKTPAIPRARSMEIPLPTAKHEKGRTEGFMLKDFSPL